MIAISQRRRVVALHRDGDKYILEDLPTVLAKANQALATLDKYRLRLDEVSTRLTALEFEGGATLHDVLVVLQRTELVMCMAVEVERHVAELGTAGRLIAMQLEETLVDVAPNRVALVRDYVADRGEPAVSAARERLAHLGHHDLLDLGVLAGVLGYERKLLLDSPVTPRGRRILRQVPRLSGSALERIVGAFGGLDEILAFDRCGARRGRGDGRAREGDPGRASAASSRPTSGSLPADMDESTAGASGFLTRSSATPSPTAARATSRRDG